MKLPSLLQSSVDPKKLSLTVKAVILGVIPFLAIIKAVTGLDIAPGVIEQIADTAGQAITAIWAAVSLIGILWGLIRKIRKPENPDDPQ